MKSSWKFALFAGLILLLAGCQVGGGPVSVAVEHVKQGISLLEQKQYDDAITELTAAIQAEPANAQAYAKRAKAYVEKGDADKAIEDANTAIKYKAGYSEAFLVLAQALLKKGDAEEAWSKALTANQTDPTNDETIFWLAMAQKATKRIPQAIATFEKFIGVSKNTELVERAMKELAEIK